MPTYITLNNLLYLSKTIVIIYMNKYISNTPDNSGCAALVTLRIIPEDKTEAYWIAKNYKCSTARIFREALWLISEKSSAQPKGIQKSNLITDWDPLQGNLLVEDSRATRMFSMRLTVKERAECQNLAALYQSSMSSVFRAGLRMLFPIIRKKMGKAKGPSFFQ